VHRRVLIALLLLPSCTAAGDGETGDASGESAGETGEPTGGEEVRPNWHQDIAPLTVQHCQSCHVSGGIAPFAMATYAETKPWAAVMAIDVEEATMPPWHAVETDECAPPLPFKHDARLSDDEKALFKAWADAGAPEGDPSLAAPLPEPAEVDLVGTTATATMASAVQIPAAGTVRDYFHCLSLDPGNTETVYLDGMQVIPGNRSVVHHVLIYVDPTGESAAWSGGVKPDCGGGAGIAGKPQLIAGWVPGSMPIEPPPDVGTELPPGTRLILNVHYHAGMAPETDDSTALALRWSSAAPAWTSRFALVGDPGIGQPNSGELAIPAGATGHVESYTWTIPGQQFPDTVEARVWAIAGHMHKVGVDLRVAVEDGETGAETCLLQTPKWDYNWQRSYAYDAPVTGALRVRGGDKIHVRCTYDNSLANPGVQEILTELGLDAPVEVTVGEGTLNEMCLAGVGLAIRGAP
jgi:hypothetical protein